jgi:superfamily I DNA/RNA helicase
MEEYDGTVTRVFGPPGTGKTRYLADNVKKLVIDNGPDSVLISSFSTTAANEIASRFADNALPPNKKMVGTLHSHAYRATGHGNVALDPKVIADWNEQATPEMRITADKRGTGGDTGKFVTDPMKAVTGDDHLGCMDLLRAKMIPRDEWPRNIMEFATRWDAWKRDAGAVDFSDMIEGAYQRALDGEHAPGNPQFIVSDESQDMTPLETSLVLAWGRHATRTVLAGDDDQAINGWRGGSPGPMVSLHGPDVSDHMLTKSHRVPENVRLVAESWIRRVSYRKDKTYTARTRMEGEVDTGEVIGGTVFGVPETLGSPDLVVRINRDLDAGKDVMVVASCNYMLAPLVDNLRAEGVPFHNPYRPAETRWNPFGGGRDDVMSTAERVYRYLVLTDRDWTGDDLAAWMDLVKIKDAGLVSTAKQIAAQLAAKWGHDPVPYDDIPPLFATDDALDWATRPDPDWLGSCLLKAKQQYASYPLEVARQHGHAALRQPPRVVVGTVHSVKGAGADVVYLAPDVSRAAVQQKTRANADELIRLFYVGMTRAKESLRVLMPSGAYMPRLIPTGLEAM